MVKSNQFQCVLENEDILGKKPLGELRFKMSTMIFKRILSIKCWEEIGEEERFEK